MRHQHGDNIIGIAVNNMKNFKLRIYDKDGNLTHEEYFDSMMKLEDRYMELTGGRWSPTNPTAWEFDGTYWQRLCRY